MSGRYGLQIRAATATDASGVTDLLRLCGQPATPAAVEGRIEATRRRPGTILLAEEWGPPSGLVALSWGGDLLEDAPVASLDLILVAPDDRRRGIGRLLLKAGSQAARLAGCGRLRLLLPEGAAGLPEFCAANGFAPSGGIVERRLRKG